MGCRGGGQYIIYNILTPPPSPKNIQEQYLYIESSDNLASTHKTFTYHRQYYSMVDISFLWDGGGVNMLLYNKLRPPSKKYSRTAFCLWNPVTT